MANLYLKKLNKLIEDLNIEHELKPPVEKIFHESRPAGVDEMQSTRAQMAGPLNAYRILDSGYICHRARTRYDWG